MMWICLKMGHQYPKMAISTKRSRFKTNKFSKQIPTFSDKPIQNHPNLYIICDPTPKNSRTISPQPAQFHAASVARLWCWTSTAWWRAAPPPCPVLRRRCGGCGSSGYPSSSWPTEVERGESRWGTNMDVGQNKRPRGLQMWMSSVVLTIQLLGYLILTHTHMGNE